MPYQVAAYSIDTLKKLFVEHSDASSDGIERRTHATYFEEYFDKVHAATIVVEDEYIDHDYLEDFSAYYVKCFQAYRRESVRLHFFSEAFDEAKFAAHLAGTGGPTADDLQHAYLGFVVLKPLPASIIGRTCLMQYPADDGRRQFPATREYEANLYGTSLRVESLAFQEQDSVTSACATSALWSAMQATARMFQHYLPSPVEITKAATVNHPLRSRALPNTDGLTLEQMADAIRAVGLEPLHAKPADMLVLKAVVYGYLRAGIPPLLIHRLEGLKAGQTPRVLGLHAVAVTGYSLPPAARGQHPFASDGIDRFYVHDDQVGPFARMVPKTTNGDQYLSTSWGFGSGFDEVRAYPTALLLPLYNKIRIPFWDVHQALLQFDAAIRALRRHFKLPEQEWDVHLTNVRDLKADIRAKWPVSSARRHELATSTLPRFMWQATAKVGDIRLIDVVFDATDIATGRYVRVFEVHDPNIAALCDTCRQTPRASRQDAIMQALGTLIDKCNLAV